jgi:hypothetical protein
MQATEAKPELAALDVAAVRRVVDEMRRVLVEGIVRELAPPGALG